MRQDASLHGRKVSARSNGPLLMLRYTSRFSSWLSFHCLQTSGFLSGEAHCFLNRPVLLPHWAQFKIVGIQAKMLGIYQTTLSMLSASQVLMQPIPKSCKGIFKPQACKMNSSSFLFQGFWLALTSPVL